MCLRCSDIRWLCELYLLATHPTLPFLGIYGVCFCACTISVHVVVLQSFFSLFTIYTLHFRVTCIG
jgi:hypothetical protein